MLQANSTAEQRGVVSHKAASPSTKALNQERRQAEPGVSGGDQADCGFSL